MFSENNVLLININYNPNIQSASLAVSPKTTKAITDSDIEAFTPIAIDVEEKIPNRLIITSAINPNLLAYVAKENSHRIFILRLHIDSSISSVTINKKHIHISIEFY